MEKEEELIFAVRTALTDPREQAALYDLLIECDEDFVPPLSFRRNTTQTDLRPAERNAEGLRDYWRALLPQHTVLCLCADLPVGFLSFRPEYRCEPLGGEVCCYLSTMAVRHAFRGRHISPQLYREALKWSGENFPERPVLLRTWSTNRAQMHLMPELGFSEVQRLPDDRGAGVDTVYYRQVPGHLS